MDDAPANQALLKVNLERLGYESVVQSDADGALETLKTRREELLAVFLDLSLNGGRAAGLALLDEIKKRAPEIPVIAYSAFEAQGSVEAVQHGAICFIDKVARRDDDFSSAIHSVLRNWEETAKLHATEAHRDFLQRLIDSVPYELMVRDRKGLIVLENEVKANRFGGRLKPGKETNCWDRYEDDEECRERGCACEEAFRENMVQRRYYSWQGMPGRRGRELHLVAAPMGKGPDGDDLVVETARDVSLQVGFQELTQEIAANTGNDRESVLKTVVKHFVGEHDPPMRPGGGVSHANIGFTRARAYLVIPRGGFERIELRAYAGTYGDKFDHKKIRFTKQDIPAIGRFWDNSRNVQKLTARDFKGYEKQKAYDRIGHVGERIGIPIRIGNHFEGIVFADKLNKQDARGEPDERINWEEQHWCQVLADYLSEVFESIYQAEGNQWLLDTEREIAEAPDEDAIFDIILRRTSRRFGADIVQVHRRRHDGWITLAEGTGHSRDCLLRTQGHSPEIGVNARACTTNEAQFVEDCESDPDYRQFVEKYAAWLAERCPLHEPGTEAGSMAVIPFGAGDQVLGSLCLLFNERRRFDPIDRLHLESLGASMSVAFAVREATLRADEAKRANVTQAESLAALYRAAAGAQSEETIINYCLTYLTAGQALRFNRALFFRAHADQKGGYTFEFEGGIGQVGKSEFKEIGGAVRGFDFRSLLKHSSAAVASDLSAYLEGVSAAAGGALANAMAGEETREFRPGSSNEGADPAIKELSEMIGMRDFLVAGVRLDGVSYGAFVVDRPFGEGITDGDRHALDTLAIEAEQMLSQLAHRKAIIELKEMELLGRVASFIGHDLKHPLGAAQHRLRVLRKILGTKADGESHEVMENLGEDLRHATEMIDSIRSYCDTQTSIMDLNKLVREAVAITSNEAENRQVTIVLDSPTSVRRYSGYPGPLLRGLVNVIYNAIEAVYSGRQVRQGRQGGEVRVSVIESAEYTSVQISDDGIGMSPEEAGNLARGAVSFTSKPDQGLGIGFEVFRQAIAKNGAVFGVESKEEEGTSITCRFHQEEEDDDR